MTAYHGGKQRIGKEISMFLNTLIEEHPELLPDECKALSDQYLGKKIAYHEPCHLKAQRLSGASIELLKKCGLDIIDINGGCCGLAGTAGMQKKHCEMSASIGKLLADKIDGYAPDIILTECAACKMQIEHLTEKVVLHPIKLLARAL
jgi:Fe-S oxidoreductase